KLVTGVQTCALPIFALSRQAGRAEPGLHVSSGSRSPLTTWFATPAALACFRRARLGRTPVVLPPRDRAWRAVAPDFAGAVAMARSEERRVGKGGGLP